MPSKIVLAAAAAAVIALGAAVFSLSRRTRTELGPVAAAPPRIDDIAPSGSVTR